MLTVNGHIVQADEMEILQELKKQLFINGVDVFHKFVPTTNNIQTTCPFHKGGQERKPSFGILTKDRGKQKAGTCHCFRGDTRVITKFGTFEISELCDKSVEILNGNGEWELVTFRSYGVQSLMKLNIRCNTKKKEIFATPEHEWVMQDFVRKKKTYQLKPGHRLKKIIPSRVITSNIDPMGVVHGFCYGDGTQTSISKTGNRTYECCFYTSSDLELKKFFIQCGFTKFKERCADNGKTYPAVHFSSMRNLKEVPDITESPEYLLGFIAGYFAADGNCSFSNITICSSKYKDLVKVRDICTRLGIASSKIGDSFIPKGQRGCIVVRSDRWYHTLHLSRNCLPDSFFLTDKGRGCLMTKYDKIGWVVDSVEYTDIEEEVYCCQTSTHSFALEDFILTGNCFACGWTGSLEEMISNCFGYDDLGNFGMKWLAKNFQSISVDSRPDIDLGFDIVEETKTYISDEEYDKYRVYHPYMWTRKMTPETVNIFDIGYDDESKCITFPVKDEQGRILFVARRSVQTKFFNYPSDVEKPVYGLYELRKLPKYPDTIYICESMIDAITVWSYGKYAVALNGLGSESQYRQLATMPNRCFVLATDNDPSGRDARLKLWRKLRNKILYDLEIPEGKKDINDLTKEEFLECKILI